MVSSRIIGNVLLLFFSFIAILALFYFLFKRLYRRHYNGEKAPTEMPKKFKFLEDLEKKSQIYTTEDGFVVFQNNRNSARNNIFRWFLPKKPAGIQYLNYVLQTHYGTHPGGEPKIQVPPDVLTVSIPMRNFRCGTSDCTEFEPRDGTQCTYSYQMLSGAIQATWCHVEENSYLAGVCLYLENRYHDWLFDNDQLSWALSQSRATMPARRVASKKMHKVWCKLRAQWIIITRNEFGEIDKYTFNGKENRMEPVNCFDCDNHFELDDKDDELIDEIKEDEKVHNEWLKFLKIEYCDRLQKPVMIGKNLESEIVHFEWNNSISKFKLKTCAECALSAKDLFSSTSNDEPPNYEHLEMIDLLVS